MWDVTGLFDFTAWFICCICQGICTWQVNCSFVFLCFQGQWLQSCVGKYYREEKVCEEGKKKKKEMGKIGKGRNEQKYHFQKYPKSVHLLSFSAERAWWGGHFAEDNQYIELLYEWQGGTTEEQACLRPALPAAGKCYILDDSVLLHQKSTRIALKYGYCFTAVTAMLHRGDCNASAEMLVHWGNATDSESGPWDKQ